MLLIALGARQVMSTRKPKTIEDSKAFNTTLNDFTPCIEAACKTPRAVKQLINRIRLYAMLLRHWSTAENTAIMEQLLKGQEGNLVIFGILEKLCPLQLREALKHPETPGLRIETSEAVKNRATQALRVETSEPDVDFSKFNDRANQAIQTLAGTAMRKDFERLVRAIEID
jgi:hypothetical protein